MFVLFRDLEIIGVLHLTQYTEKDTYQKMRRSTKSIFKHQEKHIIWILIPFNPILNVE